MFLRPKLGQYPHRDDSGIAVVAAMGVAFVLMLFLTVVVAVTVTTTNNSGRDRVRTAAIHSAEGAIDATFAEMENAIPCGAPSFSPITVGDGTQSTIVDVTIEYFSDEFSTPVSCSGGTLGGSVEYAIVTATSVPANAVKGLQPTRILEARVAVTERGGSVKLPGIYSAGNMYFDGTPDVFSEVDDGSPDIWIDTGDLYCTPTINRQTEIEADVVVGQGDANLQEWCWFDRNVFVGGDMSWNNSAASNSSQVNYRCNSKFICGDLTVAGDLSIASNAERLTTGGDVTVGGSISGSSYLVADGAVTAGASGIETQTVRGFPSVQYDPADWFNAYGMVEKDEDDFVDLLDFKSGYSCSGWGRWRTCTSYNYDETDVAGCDFDSRYYDDVIDLGPDPQVFDLRDCSGNGSITSTDVMKFSRTNTIKVNADTAFFVSGFFNSGTMNFVSGDGDPHSIWIIVADDGVPAYNGSTSCSSPRLYSLCSTSILTSTAEAPIMWYTKHLFYSDGKSNSINDMYGQMFAGSVYFKGYLDLQFETLTVPGEILWESGEPGLDVQLLAKRELPSS